VLRGRGFSEADRAEAPGVVIVNQHMAELVWPGLDPVGRRLRFGSDPSTPWLTVIGVVGDVRQVALNEDVRFETYRSASQEPRSYMAMLARTWGDPVAAISSIRNAIWEVDPNLAVFGERSMAQIRAANSDGIASITWLLVVFGAIALTLAAGGLYGVMTYIVSWRTQEIGIRMALGAQTSQILRQVVGRALLLTLLGIAGGFIIAFAMSGVLESLLFGVARMDAITFASVACLLVLVGVLASYMPARHAAAIQPVTALRQE
jgi:putative ABC transport system permease protein